MTSRDDEADALASPEASDDLPTTRRKREAEEWALVLASQGFEPKIARTEAGFSVVVPPSRQEEAVRHIRSWRAERAERAAAKPLPPPPETTLTELALAYALALSMLAFHLGLEAAGRHAALVDRGDSQAALVMTGQVWRTLTALTLHADLPHVAGNALFGGFFLAAVAGRLGLGCAVLAFFASGALGNLGNALYYGAAHSSVGASTGVFGLVGVLAGLAAWRRHQLFPPRRGAWIAFAAGLAVVGMLGGPGPQVDFSAHLFGLAAGAVSGVAISYPLGTRPRLGRRAQVLAFASSALLVWGAWQFA